MKRILFILVMLLAMSQASGLQITEPENREYNISSISFEVSHPEDLDNISYSIDNGELVKACDNCSSYQADLDLSEKDHLLEVFGKKGNQTLYDNVSFSIDLPEDDFKLSVISPEAKTYYSEKIFLSAKSNTTLDRIRYRIDGGSYIEACKNCGSFNKTIDLSEGPHTLQIEGKLDDRTKVVSVKFSIEIDGSFTLEILSPSSKEYAEGMVPIKIRSNETLDRIRVRLEGYDNSCYNCSAFNDTLNLSSGKYTLKAEGKLGKEEEERAFQFTVRQNASDYENKSYVNKTKPGKIGFDTGFEKLPKLVESGGISDIELAKILAENQLNPGIINRLIKTGKLGNESLDAILDHQKFTAVGIWDKTLLFFGYKGHTYAAQIASVYRLPEKIEQKLISRDDIPKGIAKKVEKELEKKSEEKSKAGPAKKSAGNAMNKSKSMEIGEQLPPGLDKKINGSKGKGRGN